MLSNRTRDIVKEKFGLDIVIINENAINKEVQEQITKLTFNTFRISTKRQDKNFHLPSQDINKIIGEKVVQTTAKNVDLKSPDLNMIIEIVNGKAYIGYKRIAGYGGLPVGTGEKALSLILSDNRIRINLATQARITIEEGYSFEAITNIYINLYEDMCFT